MKVAFTTLGCRVNQYETEAMKEIFVKEDHDIVSFNEFADVYVINTCTVTQTGDKKSRQMINRAKKHNSDAIVAVVGCYSQISPEEISNIPSVDVVLGTKNKSEILHWVQRAKDENQKFVKVNEVLKDKKFEDLNIEEQEDKSRAFLKIQDGCNRFCSYCLIPYARGPVCSKEPSKIFEEASSIVSNGYKEIVLTGIHIASYGLDFKDNISLINVLDGLEKIEGLERVRLGSIDPTFFTDENIEKVKDYKKLCNHFHLSLQSGCSSVLKRMNRKYTAEVYEDIVHKLRKDIPNVAITTDIIVGFPGETEEEFNETFKFLKNIKLSDIHVFKYSKRKGTKAYEMEDSVGSVVKESRSKEIINLNLENNTNFLKEQLNSNVEVLIEKNEGNLYSGYSRNYLECTIESEASLEIGDIYTAKVIDVKNSKLICML